MEVSILRGRKWTLRTKVVGEAGEVGQPSIPGLECVWMESGEVNLI